jgi:hypothetical protein
LPSYFLTEGAVGRRTAFFVHDAVTGAVRAQVIAPPGIAWAGIAPAGYHGGFVLTGGPMPYVQGAPARFYWLCVGSGGRIRAGPVLIPVPAVSSVLVPSAALTADGTKLAVRRDGGVEVYDLTAGRTRAWEVPVAQDAAGDLSWAGDRILAFDWTGSGQDEGIRLLDTAAPGTSVLASRLVIPAYGSIGLVDQPLISGDGSMLFGTVGATVPGAPTIAVMELSASTGQPLRTLLRVPAASARGRPEPYCGVLAADASGQHVLLACGGRIGRSDNGRFTPLHWVYPPPFDPASNPVGAVY